MTAKSDTIDKIAIYYAMANDLDAKLVGDYAHHLAEQDYSSLEALATLHQHSAPTKALYDKLHKHYDASYHDMDGGMRGIWLTQERIKTIRQDLLAELKRHGVLGV